MRFSGQKWLKVVHFLPLSLCLSVILGISFKTHSLSLFSTLSFHCAHHFGRRKIIYLSIRFGGSRCPFARLNCFNGIKLFVSIWTIFTLLPMSILMSYLVLVQTPKCESTDFTVNFLNNSIGFIIVTNYIQHKVVWLLQSVYSTKLYSGWDVLDDFLSR